ncbi:hypothetical protein BH11GEM1_BH11GEM1_17130 [soil metagenome]
MERRAWRAAVVVALFAFILCSGVGAALVG